MSSLLQSTSYLLVIVFLTYVAFILVPYLKLQATPPGDPAQFLWHALIPCRDEESVIGDTIATARATFPQMHIWVIDDDSDDETAAIVESLAGSDPMVHLVRRVRPHARTGKGPALNAGYGAVSAWLPHPIDRSRVIVAVLDADGELSGNALAAVSADTRFADPRVGAVQLAVRMKNRDESNPLPGKGRIANAFSSWLLRMQDVEFRTVILAMQSLRSKTGTVGMGGNGQFTRLSVLDAITETYGSPWHGSLLEDYELGLHVIFAGYQNRQVHDSHVSQEAVPTLSRLTTQRARWGQGVMQCMRYLPTILRSRFFDSTGVLEAGYYLLLPVIQLVGYAIFLSLLGSQMLGIAYDRALRELWWSNLGGMSILVLLFGIGPFAIWGFVYKLRCEPDLSWRRATLIGVTLWPYQLYVAAALAKAVYRLALGRNGWSKTLRAADTKNAGTIAIEA
ncbi:glycosyltransferase family 2 protein [Leifsonia sp. LS-T14]|uniref:glycosyltransferase family 2 protein n=1 Tax=unclassified Leifsonia TaxID=2663824 RepID=UPI0035A611CD